MLTQLIVYFFRTSIQMSNRSRVVLCYSDEMNEECDELSKPIDQDSCHQNLICDDDLNVVNKTEVCSPNDEDGMCSILGRSGPIIENCASSQFGCCNDNITAASGPFKKGCPINCTKTRFGCCEDGVTSAEDNERSNCVIPAECNLSEFGCCPDGTTTKKDKNDKCEENLLGSNCKNSKFECCQDEQTAATEPNNEGCFNTVCSDEGSGAGAESICNETAEITVDIEPFNFTSLYDLYGNGSEFFGDCHQLEFGCCADTITPASGPDEQGCPECSETQFGCCPNNKTTARGPNMAGCPCNSFPYGCCPDNKTPASGERYLGCTCEHYPHGCCQDKYTPARGPNYDGCICTRMLYGCCPDRVTPASGENNFGCGCGNTPFGCCPDNVTAAQGTRYEGCPCESLPFGCCPDRITPALGLNFEGCSCDSLPHGCCPDNRTPARGPRYGGCNCATTPYGCCHDGVAVSFGPNFEGCPDGPSLDITKASEACSLPKERGTCRNYTVKWYFDMTYGGCTRFWYGGCEGNANRFQSQEECERTCVESEGPAVCYLPKVIGPCKNRQFMYYFDSQTKQCEPFEYGGCLGNKNRFSSKLECENYCLHPDDIEPCEQPMVTGVCRGAFQRWYYNKAERRCKSFIFGGCQGNKNNFATERECHETCAIKNDPREICALPQGAGQCLGRYPRWYFDSYEGVCKEFIYTGCSGNKNQFMDKNRCEQFCNRTQAVSRRDVCTLPRAEGPCQQFTPQWYFNSQAQRCERFYYGGCEGNGNRFELREDCERVCLPSSLVSDVNVCQLRKDPGSCYNFEERWYFEVEDSQCHRFYYSSCGGNGNNFHSSMECEQLCGRRTPPPRENIEEFRSEHCSLSSDHGPCSGNEPAWFYDRTDGVCKQFYYGGCGGNHNRFLSRKECETKCWNSQDICKLPKVRGPCSGEFVQWYYDERSSECQEFSYGGCQGNANRFDSKTVCEEQCKKDGRNHYHHPEVNHRGPINPICKLQYDPGPCRGYIPLFYYDIKENTCRAFIYGGCRGNKNRFTSRKECDELCTFHQSSAR